MLAGSSFHNPPEGTMTPTRSRSIRLRTLITHGGTAISIVLAFAIGRGSITVDSHVHIGDTTIMRQEQPAETRRAVPAKRTADPSHGDQAGPLDTP